MTPFFWVYFHTVHWPGRGAASSFRQLKRAKRECNATSAVGRGCARFFPFLLLFSAPLFLLSLFVSLSHSCSLTLECVLDNGTATRRRWLINARQICRQTRRQKHREKGRKSGRARESGVGKSINVIIVVFIDVHCV